MSPRLRLGIIAGLSFVLWTPIIIAVRWLAA